MTDRAALLAAVAAAPDDPLPRLVFADYLDEAGDPDWAELIRLQNGFFTDGSNRPEMKARVAELIAATADRFPVVPGIAFGPPVRGFPEAVTFPDIATTQYDLEAAATTIADWPVTWFLIRRRPGTTLTPNLIEPKLLALLAARARFVEIPAGLSAEDRNAILATVSAGRLKVLGWRDAWVDNEDAERIAAAPSLGGLEELYLPGNSMSQAGADALAAAPHLSKLRMLDLSGSTLGFDARRLERRFGPALRLA